jgi:hypothetical protein
MLIIFDRKQDFKGLLRYPNFVYFDYNQFFDNPLRAPPGVNPKIWVNIFLEILANFFDIRVSTRNLLLDRILLLFEKSRYLYDGIHCPTLKTLYSDIKSLKFALLSRWSRYQESALNRLLGLLSVFGETISSGKYVNWNKLAEIDFGLSLLGLPVDYANFIIATIAAKLILFRIAQNQRGQGCKNVLVIDECSTVFRRALEVRESGPYILSDLLVQAREFGVSFLLASQTLLDLSVVVQANCARKIMISGFGMGQDYQIFGSSVGLDVTKTEFAKTRNQPGDGIGYDPRYPYAFSLQVPYFPLDKNISEHLIRERVKQFESTIFETEPEVATESQTAAEAKQDNTRVKSEDSNQKKGIRLSLDADRVLRGLSQDGCPFRFQGQIFDSAGISSGTKQKRIKSELTGSGLIREHRLQRGKGFLIFWEITDKGWAYLNQIPPQYKGKGGWLHQAAAYFLKEWSKGNGFVCRLEAQIGPDKKAVDALLTKETGESWIVEFVFSDVAKELSNLLSDLGSGLEISKLVFACRDGKLKQKLQSEMESCPEFHQNREKVVLCLAGDFCLT